MTMWIGLGSQFSGKRYVYKYPTSTSLCSAIYNHTANYTLELSSLLDSQNYTTTTTQSVEELIAERYFISTTM